MFGLSTLEIKGIILAVITAVAFAGGVILEGKISKGRYEALKSEYAQAQIKAIEKAVETQRQADQVTSDAVASRAASSDQIAVKLRQRLSEIESHEKELLRGCVTFEFVRQLRLYIRDLPGDSLAIPAGKSAGDCAPISGLRLERAIVTNLAIGRDNADRFNQLAAWARRIEEMRPKNPPPGK